MFRLLVDRLFPKLPPLFPNELPLLLLPKELPRPKLLPLLPKPPLFPKPPLPNPLPLLPNPELLLLLLLLFRLLRPRPRRPPVVPTTDPSELPPLELREERLREPMPEPLVPERDPLDERLEELPLFLETGPPATRVTLGRIIAKILFWYTAVRFGNSF